MGMFSVALCVVSPTYRTIASIGEKCVEYGSGHVENTVLMCGEVGGATRDWAVGQR